MQFEEGSTTELTISSTAQISYSWLSPDHSCLSLFQLQ